MSSLLVEVCKIESIEPIEKADKLELALVKGWYCVVQKDRFKPGDLCVYIPIDSILPQELEDLIFGVESKIRLEKHRVRTIKLRGQISQGLICGFETLGMTPKPEGTDLAKELGITKYEAKVGTGPQSNCGQKSRKAANPHFRKYTDIENFKNYPQVFKEGEEVSMTEKIHGSNVRFAYLPTEASTLWKKLLKLLGLLPKYEYCVGSHNIQLQDRPKSKTFHGTNIYQEAFNKYNIKDVLQPGYALYGEVYGPNIQKGYHYECEEGERKLVLFDLMVDGEYAGVEDFQFFCKVHQLPMAPELYRGYFISAEHAKGLTIGNSVLAPTQEVREGIVIKPISNTNCNMGRKVLKLISDDYLLNKNNTDFH